MKTKNPELFTSKPANQNPLWQEIPEDSAETLKGGYGNRLAIGVLFLSSAKKKTRPGPGAGGPIDLDSAFGFKQ